MARHLFIAQQTLSTWLEQDKIAFDKNIMTIKADGRAFRLVEAVRFVKVEGDDTDKPGLLGRVKTNKQLEDMGAERYRDSVLFEDIAYKVQEGFIGEVFLKKAPEKSCEPAKVEPSKVVPKPKPKPVTLKPVKSQNGAASPLQAKCADAANPNKKKPAKVDGEQSDEELLTKFLLDNL